MGLELKAWEQPRVPTRDAPNLRAGEPHDMLTVGTVLGIRAKMPKMTLDCVWEL